jgi:hypothetical protein
VSKKYITKWRISPPKYRKWEVKTFFRRIFLSPFFDLIFVEYDLKKTSSQDVLVKGESSSDINPKTNAQIAFSQ